MKDKKKEWTEDDVKNWRLDLIKQRHKEVVLTRRDGSISDAVIEDDDFDLPDLEGADEAEALGLNAGYKMRMEY